VGIEVEGIYSKVSFVVDSSGLDKLQQKLKETTQQFKDLNAEVTKLKVPQFKVPQFKVPIAPETLQFKVPAAPETPTLQGKEGGGISIGGIAAIAGLGGSASRPSVPSQRERVDRALKDARELARKEKRAFDLNNVVTGLGKSTSKAGALSMIGGIGAIGATATAIASLTIAMTKFAKQQQIVTVGTKLQALSLGLQEDKLFGVSEAYSVLGLKADAYLSVLQDTQKTAAGLAIGKFDESRAIARAAAGLAEFTQLDIDVARGEKTADEAALLKRNIAQEIIERAARFKDDRRVQAKFQQARVVEPQVFKFAQEAIINEKALGKTIEENIASRKKNLQTEVEREEQMKATAQAADNLGSIWDQVSTIFKDNFLTPFLKVVAGDTSSTKDYLKLFTGAGGPAADVVIARAKAIAKALAAGTTTGKEQAFSPLSAFTPIGEQSLLAAIVAQNAATSASAAIQKPASILNTTTGATTTNRGTNIYNNSVNQDIVVHTTGIDTLDKINEFVNLAKNKLIQTVGN